MLDSLPSALLAIAKKRAPGHSLPQGEQPHPLQPLLPQGLQSFYGLQGPLLGSHHYGRATLMLGSYKVDGNFGLSGAEPRTGITFCNLIATIFLMQPRVLSDAISAWVWAASWCPPGPKLPAAKLFGSPLAPACSAAGGSSSPSAGLCIKGLNTTGPSLEPCSAPAVSSFC